MSSDESKSRWPTWLIVLIVVVAVLLVMFCLVAIACAGMFFAVRAPVMQQQAEAAMTKAQISLIESAVEHYQLMVGEYPTTEQGLSALEERPADLAESSQWYGPYLEELPLDAWDNPYQYELRDGNPSIWSFGRDGIDGTDDDIGNW